MALVEIFRSRKTGQLVISPFARHRDGGNVARGKLEHFSEADFIVSGGGRICSLMNDFYEKTDWGPSELYNVMSDKDRDEFLEAHDIVLLFTLRKGDSEATLWLGDTEIGKVSLIQEHCEIAAMVLDAFSDGSQMVE